MADMDIELPMDRLARNFSLVLRLDFFEVDVAVAMRAVKRQRSLVSLVDD